MKNIVGLIKNLTIIRRIPIQIQNNQDFKPAANIENLEILDKKTSEERPNNRLYIEANSKTNQEIERPKTSVIPMNYTNKFSSASNFYFSSAKEKNIAGYGQYQIKLLHPESDEDFQDFKKIITNKGVLFTSSWISSWFDVDQIKKRCEIAKTLHPEDTSSYQVAIDNFFNQEERDTKLREIYTNITKQATSNGIGYYRFSDQDGNLIGGGALAPLSEDGKIVDVALHILKPQQGIGSYYLEKLLKLAFEEKNVKQIWGSSLINHRGTPTLCAKFGMIIQNIEDMKYYYIDREMWEVNKNKVSDIVLKRPKAASTHFRDLVSEKGNAPQNSDRSKKGL